MSFTYIRPQLYTPYVKESVDFYVKQLHFHCDVYDESTQWAAVSRDNIQIMLTYPNAHVSFTKPLFTGALYITIDNGIDDLWEELKGKAPVCYPIETFDYGMREFALYDNNGYLLQFGQEAPL